MLSTHSLAFGWHHVSAPRLSSTWNVCKSRKSRARRGDRLSAFVSFRQKGGGRQDYQASGKRGELACRLGSQSVGRSLGSIHMVPSSGSGISCRSGALLLARGRLGCHWLSLIRVSFPSFRSLAGSVVLYSDCRGIVKLQREAREGQRKESSTPGSLAMSAEYAGKRQRGSGDGRTASVRNPAEASATSSADLESMLKQALCRVDSLERQHEAIKMTMEREIGALRDDISILKEESNSIQASTERETKALRDDVNALKSENKALKWSLDLLAWKAQEDWEYPVAIQPDEYWRSKGYEDDAIHNLNEYFFENVKRAVSELAHGVPCDYIYVGNADYDEDLLPHWEALFRSFQNINPHDAGVELCIQSIELNEELMRRICYFVRHRNISQVDFSHNGFTNLHGAISELGNALKSSKLKSLQWDRNPIASTEDMTLFTRVLSQNNAVTS